MLLSGCPLTQQHCSAPFLHSLTLILIPSLPLAPFPLLLSCPPNPLLRHSLFPPLSLPGSQLWIWRYTWSRGRVGFKRKGVPETAIFFLFSSYLELPSGGPACAFPPSCRDQAPHGTGPRLSWECWSFLKNTLSRPTRITLLVGQRVRITC